MKYEFLKADITSIVSLPSEFIDKYMLKANGDYIKVYLFMLRNADRLINPEIIADALELTIKDVERAIAYWCKSGALIEKAENIGKLGNGDDFEEVLITKGMPSKEELEEARRILTAAKEVYKRREMLEAGMGAEALKENNVKSESLDEAKNPKESDKETLDPAKDTDVENNSEGEVKAEIPEVKTEPPKLPDRSLVDLTKLRFSGTGILCADIYGKDIYTYRYRKVGISL